MNKELNLAKILMNAPKGTKLYSPLFGEVFFDKITLSSLIYVNANDGMSYFFDKYGRYSDKFKDSECTLFPSKYQRDWNKFKADLPIDTPVMISDEGVSWYLRYYAGNRKCYADGNKYIKYMCEVRHKYIVPVSDFDFINPESNISKSI